MVDKFAEECKKRGKSTFITGELDLTGESKNEQGKLKRSKTAKKRTTKKEKFVKFKKRLVRKIEVECWKIYNKQWLVEPEELRKAKFELRKREPEVVCANCTCSLF